MTSLLRMGLRSLIRAVTPDDTPPTGQRALLARADGWYDRNDQGVEVRLGGGGSTGTPTYIPPDKRFVVEADTQVLYKANIRVEGVLRVAGTLIEVR